MSILVYGANGYTGDLIAHLAARRGVQVTLAGRRAEAVRPLAESLKLPWRAFALDDAAALDAGLAGHAVVLHCAGPFSRTSKPMAAACLRNRVHYLDITGEAPVFMALAARDAEARDAGVMLLPGVGFDVVPSDCLAAHVAAKRPGATRLTLAFQTTGGVSHGTATTMVENIGQGGLVRRGGELLPVPNAYDIREVDFGRGPAKVVSIPWGDVVTAWYSTGIPDITVYMRMPAAMRFALRFTPVAKIAAAAPVQRFLKRRLDAGPAGPSAEARARARTTLFAEASNETGSSAARLDIGDSYDLTADAALRIARRVDGGTFVPGFQTPSRVYGPDFVLECDGVTRTDA